MSVCVEFQCITCWQVVVEAPWNGDLCRDCHFKYQHGIELEYWKGEAACKVSEQLFITALEIERDRYNTLRAEALEVCGLLAEMLDGYDAPYAVKFPDDTLASRVTIGHLRAAARLFEKLGGGK